jgi:hypothetical protein
MWDDEHRYAKLSEAARAHAGRAETNPASIAGTFEGLLRRIVEHPSAHKDTN